MTADDETDGGKAMTVIGHMEWGHRHHQHHHHLPDDERHDGGEDPRPCQHLTERGADTIACARWRWRKRGRISLFAGFSRDDTAVMDVNAIHYNELKITGSFGLTRLQFTRALALIASGRLDLGSLLTHRFGLSEIEQALRVAEQGAAIKVAII